MMVANEGPLKKTMVVGTLPEVIGSTLCFTER
jgi:hypothetical protein